METWADYLRSREWPVLGKLFLAWGATIASAITMSELTDYLGNRFRPWRKRA